MSAPRSVLGVVHLFGVVVDNPTQAKPTIGAGSGGLCWVCGVCARAHVCACSFHAHPADQFRDLLFSYAKLKKPNKPHTPKSSVLEALIFKGFKCVGFVWGWAFMCGVGVFEGVKVND